jgi:AcrR family transcriptional regulator
MTPTKTKGDDLRIRRTYKLLGEALYSLLEEKSFDDLSVIDICERAMIHRTTFYRHFEDKYHLMAYCVQRLTEEFAAASLAIYDEKNPKAYHLDVIRRTLRHFAEHKRMILLLADQRKSDFVRTTLHEVISRDIQRKLEERKKTNKRTSFRVPISVFAEYHAGALISLTFWWLRNSMPYSEDRLTHYIDVLMNMEGIESTGRTGTTDEPVG